MTKEEQSEIAGLNTLGGFPVVLVTVVRNVMTAAAFSFYSFDPPSVMVGIRPQAYTHELLSVNRDFGINLPTVEQLEIVRICGSVSGRDVDKFAKTGMTPFQGKMIQSVLIKECPVNLECQVVHEIDYGGSHRWFIGEIKTAHIDNEFQRDKVLMYWGREFRRVGDILLKVDRR